MDNQIFKFLLLWIILLRFGDAKLLKPRRLKTLVVSPTSIKCMWHYPKNQPSKNIIFKVKYTEVGTRNKKSKTVNTDDTSVIIGNLKHYTTYEFTVRAQDDRGRGRTGPWSSTTTNRTLKRVSGIVSNFQATPLSSTSIKLTWKRPPERNRTSGFFVLWTELDRNQNENKVAVSRQANSSIFLDLVPYQSYSFRVVTLKANGVEKSTDRIIARTFADRPGQAPRNVSLMLLANSVLQVKWLPPPMRKRHGMIETYKLQYRRKGSRRGDICTVTLSERPRRYNLTELQKGETYRIRLAARTINGTGPYSKWASIDIPQKGKGKRRKPVRKYQPMKNDETPRLPEATRTPNSDIPEMPEGLMAKALSSTMIKLTWNTPSSPACCPIVAYTIHVTNLDDLKDEREIVTGTNTEIKVEDLDPSTLYGFNVTAFNTHGVSQHSLEIKQNTKDPVEPRIVNIHHSEAIEGGIVNVTCIAVGDPLPWVSWHSTSSTAFAQSHSEVKSFLNRQPEKGTNEMIVMFQDVSTRQAGEYMCVAKNVAGRVNATLDLQVKVPVRFVKVEGDTAMIKSSVNLTCGASGVPLPSLTWLTPNGIDASTDDRAKIFKWIETESEYDHIGKIQMIYSILQLDNISMADGGHYECLAQNEVNFSRRKADLQIKVPPPPPVENLRTFPISPSVVQVAWDRPDYDYNITSYKVIYRQKDSRVEESIETAEQLCHINDLTPNKMYKIKVLAFNKRYGNASRTEVLTLNNKKLQPANVSAVAINSSIIRLNWEAPSSIDIIYIKGYNIYYRKQNGTKAEKLFTEGNRNKQFLVGLGNEDIYHLRISTLMTWGDEAPSSWIEIKKDGKDSLPPPEPTNVLITPASQKVRITWDIPVDEKGQPFKNLKGYRIAYGPKHDMTAKIKKIRVSKEASRITITHLLPGTAYIISLRSFNDNGESSPIYLRTTTKATRPGPVQSASANPLSSTKILVSWLTPTKGQVTDYHVRYWRPYKNDKQSQWIKAPRTNLTAVGLRKFREYKFEIIPYHDGEIGESIVLFARTKSDVPDAPPRNIRIKALNSSAMLIRWESPPKASQNGRITGYKLVFKRVHSSKPLAIFTVDNNHKNYTFYGLEPSMEYKARVAAMTIRGTGPYSRWHAGKTKEVDKLPPDRPSALILTSTEKSIIMNWTRPRYTGAPLDGYIIGYGRYIPEVNRRILTDDQLSYVIGQLRENTEYIISVRAFNKFGESAATYDFIKTKDFPVKLEPPQMIRALTLSTTSIGIYWIDPALNKFKRRDRRLYTLRYSSAYETEYTYLNVSKPPVILNELEVDTQYEFAIRVVRNDEHSTWSLPESNTTFMNPPILYPTNLTVTATDIPSKVIVSWKHVKRNPLKTEKYILYYTTDPRLNITLWNKTELKSGKKSLTIEGLESTTNYYFKIQAGNSGGNGPFSPMIAFRSFAGDERSAPTDIRIRPLNSNMSTTVDISWSAPVETMGAITGYLVSYTSTPEVKDSWITKIERGLSTIIIGLQYETVYFFKVQARYAANILGPMSKTGLYRTPVKESVSDPKKSTQVDIQEITTYPLPAINISWAGSDDTIIGYFINYTNTVSDNSSWITYRTPTPSAILYGLSYNTNYYIKIQPVRSTSLGPVLKQVLFKTSVKEMDGRPRNLVVTEHQSSPVTVDLSWLPPLKPPVTITGYRVVYSTDRNMVFGVQDIETQNTTVHLEDLIKNVTYYFHVQPIYLYNHLGLFSHQVNFTIPITETSTYAHSPIDTSESTIDTMQPTTTTESFIRDTKQETDNLPTTTNVQMATTTPVPLRKKNVPPPFNLILTSTNTTITVTWTQPIDNTLIEKYRIKYWSDDNPGIQSLMVDKVAASELSVILFNLDPGVKFTVSVESFGLDQYSDYVGANIMTKNTNTE